MNISSNVTSNNLSAMLW